jgi:hypothetical protein
LNLSSQGGFYTLRTQYTVGSDGKISSLTGDMAIDFGKMNPWLPKVGYGRNPSFSGSKAKSAGRIENSPLTDGFDLGGQDRSVVLSWSGLPPMGMAKLTHLNVAMGHDNNGNAYARTPSRSDSRTVSFGMGIAPFDGSKAMGGLNVNSVAYSLGYTRRPDREMGVTLKTNYLVTDIDMAKTPSIDGDHTYFEHGLTWSPVTFVSLAGNYATYEAKGAGGMTAEGEEIRFAATIKLWGPKSGFMAGGGKEGGLSIAPVYSSAEVDTASGEADVTVSGVSLDYAVPGGWMTVKGMWDSFSCDGDCEDMSAAAGDKDKFNVFNVIVEYKF